MLENRIADARQRLGRLESLTDVLNTLQNNANWWLDTVTDEDGNIVRDADGNAVTKEPEPDSYGYEQWSAYKWAIDVLMKAIDKI